MKSRFAITAVLLSGLLAGCPGLMLPKSGGGTPTGTTSTGAPNPTPTPSSSPTSAGSGTANLGNFPIVTESGAVSANATWDARHIYEVTGNVSVNNGATLTISPGATVSFDSSTELDIAYGGSVAAGQLIAQGTAIQPILFTSSTANPTPGSWNGIEFDGGSGHVMQYCSVLWAGGASEAAVRVNSGSVLTLADSQIAHSANAGLAVDTTSSLASFAANSFETDQGYPVTFANANAVGAIDTASTYTGNQNNAIQVHGGSVTSSQTWVDAGVPYAINGNVEVNSSAALTLSPGATLSFDPYTELDVAYGGSNPAGTLKAIGTSAAPVTFTADTANPTTGYWNGVEFDGGSGHVMQYCHVLWAGGANEAAVRVNSGSSLTLANSQIADSGNDGLAVDTTSLLPGFSTNTFASNKGFPITLNSINEVSSLDASSSFTGDTSEEIHLHASDALTGSQTWVNPGVPLYFDGSPTVGYTLAATLNLDPGLTLKFGQGDSLEVMAGTLDAGSLGGATVTFTSNDGSNDWAGLQFASGTTGTLDNVSISHAGPGAPDLTLLGNPGSSVTVGGVTLSDAGTGLQIASSATLNGITSGSSLLGQASVTGITFTGLTTANISVQ